MLMLFSAVIRRFARFTDINPSSMLLFPGMEIPPPSMLTGNAMLYSSQITAQCLQDLHVFN